MTLRLSADARLDQRINIRLNKAEFTKLMALAIKKDLPIARVGRNMLVAALKKLP